MDMKYLELNMLKVNAHDLNVGKKTATPQGRIMFKGNREDLLILMKKTALKELQLRQKNP